MNYSHKIDGKDNGDYYNHGQKKENQKEPLIIIWRLTGLVLQA